MTTTLRVAETTRDRVNQLGAQTHQSADGVLTKALDAYEDALYWAQWREARQAQTPALSATYDADAGPWDRAASADAQG